MSIQTKLENSNFFVKKKLYDNSINLHGMEINAIRLQVEYDQYGDDQVSNIISENEIVAYINIQSLEIPLNRYRLDSTTPAPATESIFLFEVLPITAYFKWEDTIETGDLLILVLKDKVENINIPIALRVSDMLGRFQHNLLMKKYNVALYNPSNISSTVRQRIVNYIDNQ